MHKLLIVDDDPTVCEGLSMILPWEEYGFVVEGSFSNGAAALDFLRENPVELVITDMKMPVMNGVRFIEEIRKRSLDCQVLILSGYDDYEYLKKAIALDVVSYLMKPVQVDELKSNIELVTERIASSRFRRLTEEGVSELRNTLFQRIIAKKIDETEMRDKLEFLGLQRILSWDSFVIGLPGHEPPASWIVDPHICLFRDWEMNPVLLARSAEVVQRACSQRLGDDVPCTTGEPVSKIQELARSYHGAWQQQMERESWTRHKEAVSDLSDPAEISDLLGGWIEEAESLESAKDLVFASLLNLNRVFPLEQLGLTLSFFSSAHSKTVLRDRVETLCNHMILLEPGGSERTGNPTIDEVVRFVQLHIGDGISLSIIADRLKMNASYLGQLFQTVMSTKFTDYVKEKRVQKAGRLLRDTPATVGEIAELCGFQDSRYFSKVFSSRTGYSPREYRKLVGERTT